MATSEALSVERDGHVATLWLDRPEKRNAMGTAFWRDLPTMIGELADDDEVRAVVIAARGPHFTVGLDLKEMGGAVASDGQRSEGARSSQASRSAQFLRNVKRLQASVTAVADCPKPVIAAVHGYCIGGGVDLITACDIRLAASDAIFSVRETKIAIVADVGTLQRLPRVIAKGHAAELAYTGKDIDAERALRIGLVNDVLPDHEATVAAAQEMAREIAANAPSSCRGRRRCCEPRRR